MARGRPRKSTAAHAASGNPGKRALRVEPTPGAAAALEPPAHLKPAAREVWNRVVPQLRAWNRLSPVDRELLAGFCALMGRHYELEDVIAEHGCTYLSPTGLVKERPEAKLSAQALNAARLIGESFGFSPQARVRLGTAEAPEDDDDPLDSL